MTQSTATAVMVKCGDTFVRITDVALGFAVRNGWEPCPSCGRRTPAHLKGTYVVNGTHNPDKICSDRCRNARRGDCECECGGEHHGVDRAGAFG